MRNDLMLAHGNSDEISENIRYPGSYKTDQHIIPAVAAFRKEQHRRIKAEQRERNIEDRTACCYAVLQSLAVIGSGNRDEYSAGEREHADDHNIDGKRILG